MRVLLATPYDLAVPGGVNQQALGLLDALTRRGVEVRLTGPSSRPLPAADPRIEVLGNIHVLPFNGAVTRVTWDATLLTRYRRLLREFVPDVVHVQEPVVPLPCAALLWLAPSGALRVGTFHTFSETSRGYLWAWPWVRAIWSRLHLRVAVSDAAREFATRYHGADFEVIPNAVEVPPEATAPRAVEEGRTGPLRLLFVGRMDEPRKGFGVLLAAVRLLEAELPGAVTLTAVGRGAEAWAPRTAGLPVTFAGELRPDLLEREYSAADLMVVPSTGGESFGLVLLEAMARGLPVVGTAIPGYVAWAREAAVLVPPRDERELADAIVSLARDPERRRRLGRQGQELSQAYQWDAIVDRWLEVYTRGTSRAVPPGLLERAEDLLYATAAAVSRKVAVARVRRSPPSAESQRGRRCRCVPAPLHLVHSEGLREACDFVVDFGCNSSCRERPPIPVDLLSVAAEGVAPRAAIHVKAELLGEFRKHVLPRLPDEVVLVTGDSDYDPMKDHGDLLDHPKIRHWFVQNCGFEGLHPRLTRIPIGIDNPVYDKLVKRLGFLLAMLRGRMPFDSRFSRNDIGDQSLLQRIRSAMSRATAERPARALCTFHQNQKLVTPDLKRFPARLEAWEILKESDVCHFIAGRIPQVDCWKMHEDFAFQVSPRGNGLDCFRTWESLFLGTIPIVKTSALDPLYTVEALPVVIVESWREITQDNLVRWREELAPRFDDSLVEKLSNAYWVEKIRHAAAIS